MREILFIAHRMPFPPDRGDKIRSHHIVKRLAELAPVHVATFAEDDFDAAEEAQLRALASSYKLVRRSKPLIIAGAQSLLSRRPASLTAFQDRALGAYVRHVLATRPISAIYVFSGQMGQYVPEAFSGRLVVDFVDVDSAKFEAYAEKRGAPAKFVYAREHRLLRAEEARLAQRADTSLLISDAEARLFRSRLPEGARERSDVQVLGNGIDSAAFDPALVEPEPRMLACAGPRLIFTGQMDYAPNVEAVIRIRDRILPLIRRKLPEASLHVVGRNPGQSLIERSGRDGCHVWGRVSDIRGWLKAADLALIPLEIARGVQNKVLEAMSMALPVVLTRGAASGIDAQDGYHFNVADADEALAESVLDLLSDAERAQRQGEAARAFVVRNASWQSALAPLQEIVGGAGRRARDAA